jgi:hypothetical protein
MQALVAVMMLVLVATVIAVDVLGWCGGLPTASGLHLHPRLHPLYNHHHQHHQHPNSKRAWYRSHWR